MPVSTTAIREGVEIMLGAGLKTQQGAEPFDGKKVAIWVQLFTDWQDERFLAACLKIAQSGTFFPSVGELRGTESVNADERAAIAWDRCRRLASPYKSLFLMDVDGDGAALWALSSVGVQTVCDMTESNRAMVYAEFRRAYAAALANEQSCDHIRGSCERQNSGQYELDGPRIGRPELPAETVKALLGDDSLALPAPTLRSLSEGPIGELVEEVG